METWPSPTYDDMRPVMAHVYEACRRNWIPIGAAPNIEVSIVVNPDDTALLAPRTPGFYAYEAYRRAVRRAGAAAVLAPDAPRPRRDPGANGEIPPASGAAGTRRTRDTRPDFGRFSRDRVRVVASPLRS